MEYTSGGVLLHVEVPVTLVLSCCIPGEVAAYWEEVIAGLQDSVRCVSDDVWGWGKSGQAASYMIANIATEAGLLIERVGGKSYVLVCRSMGARWRSCLRHQCPWISDRLWLTSICQLCHNYRSFDNIGTITSNVPAPEGRTEARNGIGQQLQSLLARRAPRTLSVSSQTSQSSSADGLSHPTPCPTGLEAHGSAANSWTTVFHRYLRTWRLEGMRRDLDFKLSNLDIKLFLIPVG